MSSLINFTGLASGLDTASIVDALVNAERAPIRRLESKRADLNSQKGIFNTIDGKLDSLSSLLDELNAPSGLASFSATSSDDDVANVAAGTGAVAGRFAINVTQLAESQRTYSDTVSARDQGGLFGTGTLSVGVGGNSFDVAVDSNTTLEDVAAAINNAGESVSASILFDGTNFRLQVSGTETGAANAVSFTESGVSLGLSTPANTVQTAQDAQFTLDGLNFTSSSNVINDAVDGLTFDLKTTGSTNVDVAIDNAAFSSRVSDLVSRYNEVVTDINAQFTNTGAFDSGGLFGDSTLRGLQSQLSFAITSPLTIGGEVSLLSSIGIETNRDGTLALDQSVLDSALTADAAGVRELFSGTATEDGFADTLAAVVDSFANSVDGRLKARTDGIDGEVRSIDGQIDRLEERILSFEADLNREFISLEQTIAQLNSQNSALISQLGGLAG